ncbi:TniQ family protein [Brevibacterium oceani]|uniref:TniQ family protein n=1 Tax=Brevibacterium oceani TaxID=358099 RepID=UPI00359C23C7
MQPKPAPAQPDRTRTSTRLRGITSGYDLDAWPLTLPIEPDETLSSWWARIAYRFGVSPAALFREIGFRMGSYTPWRVEQRLARSSTPLSVRTGIENTTRARAHTAQARISDLLSSVTTRYHVPAFPSKPAFGSRFCPLCLADTGTWSGLWRSPLVTMCSHHQVMLVDTCPHCGERPFSSPAWAMRGRENTRCTENLPRDTSTRKWRTSCDADLSQAQTTTGNQDLVAATELLLEDENWSGQDWSLAGLPATRAEARDGLILLTLDALDIQDRTAKTVAQEATALEHAYEVLMSPDLTSAGALVDHYHLLDVGGPFAAIGPTQALRDHPFHPVLHAIRLHSLRDHLPPGTQLPFRIGSDWPRTPNKLRHRHTPTPTFYENWRLPPAPFSVIPQLYWEEGLPGIDPFTNERSRFAVSIAIASVGRNITTASAAEQLGAPKVQAARVTHDWARLSDHCGWPQLRQTIVTIATQLALNPGSIDYQQRREELATPADLDARFPESDWTDAQRLWLWAEYTGSSARFAPEAWGNLRFPSIVPERPPDRELRLPSNSGHPS